MCANIDKILDLAISEGKPRESGRAVEILTAANKDISDHLYDNCLLNKAKRLLEKDGDVRELWRFLTLCFRLQSIDPESFIEKSKVMGEFCAHVGLAPVDIFIYSVIMACERMGVTQEAMADRRRVNRDLLSARGFANDIFGFDRSDARAAENALRLIAICASDDGKLADQFRCPEFVEKVLGEKAETLEVLTAKMDVLCAVVCAETSRCFVPQVKALVEMLAVDPDTGRLHVHQPIIVDIIAKLIPFEGEAIAPILAELEFGNTIAGLCQRFPAHSNLHGRVRALVLASLKCEAIRDLLLTPVLRFYYTLFREKDQNWFYGWKMLRILQKRFAEEEGLAGLCHLVVNWDSVLEEEFQKQLNVIKAGYGGEVPKVEKFTPGSGGQLTQAQLLWLLQMLQMRANK